MAEFGTSRANDLDWIRGCFGLPSKIRYANMESLRLYNTSLFNFSDTTLGGSQAINTPPQFTRYADPVIGGYLAAAKVRDEKITFSDDWDNNAPSYGKGAYYQEAIDDNSYYAHIRFGKPKYIGSIAFFANNYDADLAHLARTGNVRGLLSKIGTVVAVGVVAMIIGPVALATVLILPKIIKTLFNLQTSKYYYVKPTMNLYLRAVQTICNQQLVYRRLIPTSLLDSVSKEGGGFKRQDADINDVYQYLPSIWKNNGEFDVLSMINRYQRMYDAHQEVLDKLMLGGEIPNTGEVEQDAELRNSATQIFYGLSIDDRMKKLQEFYNAGNMYSTLLNTANKNSLALWQLEEYYFNMQGYRDTEDGNNIDNILASNYQSDLTNMVQDNVASTTEEKEAQAKQAKQKTDAAQIEVQKSLNPTANDFDLTTLKSSTTFADVYSDMSNAKESDSNSWKSIFGNMFEVIADGADSVANAAKLYLEGASQWITWKIDGKNTTSRSFSNSTKEPDISGTVNSLTSSVRSIEVNTSDGNTGIGMLDKAVSGVRDIIASTADALHMSGLMALYSSSVIDFPEVWDSSSTSGDDLTFTIKCRCWSGQDLDIFQDLIVPVAFWLAAVLPLSTGKQSYTHPFYCECYSRGRFSMRNAIVTDVNMEFGVGGLGWRSDGVPLSCDISVTIKDMSRVMHMPLVTSANFWDDDNKFSDFMGTLGALTLHQRTRAIERAALNVDVWWMNFKTHFTYENLGNFIGGAVDTATLGILSGIMGGTTRS